MATTSQSGRDARAMLASTTIYQEFQLEMKEILDHKWLESEKAGYDIGFERALVDWIIKHRAAWRRGRQAVLAAQLNSY